jgi:hypothetical protein
MKQYAAGLLPLRSVLRRFPDLIQGTSDASIDSGNSHPVMKTDDPRFMQAVVQLVCVCSGCELLLCRHRLFEINIGNKSDTGVARAGSAAAIGWSFGCCRRHCIAARSRSGTCD